MWLGRGCQSEGQRAAEEATSGAMGWGERGPGGCKGSQGGGEG